MTAPVLQSATPAPRIVADHDLILAVIQKAAFAEAEIEAAFRFREGTAVREWHLERADQATVELLGLINGPHYRAAWGRALKAAAPLKMVELKVPVSGIRRAGGLA